MALLCSEAQCLLQPRTLPPTQLPWQKEGGPHIPPVHPERTFPCIGPLIGNGDGDGRVELSLAQALWNEGPVTRTVGEEVGRAGRRQGWLLMTACTTHRPFALLPSSALSALKDMSYKVGGVESLLVLCADLENNPDPLGQAGRAGSQFLEKWLPHFLISQARNI